MSDSTRGCGERVAGGSYLECEMSEDGLPIEAYLKCPAIMVESNDEPGTVKILTDDGAKQIPPRGVHLIKMDGVYHVIDIIGRSHYPDLAGFIEEARRMGISRRAELTVLQASKLTSKSKLVLVHSRAVIKNPGSYFANMSVDEGKFFRCRQYGSARRDQLPTVPFGVTDTPYCNGLWWHDLDAIDYPMPDLCSKRNGGGRLLASGRSYIGFQRSPNIETQHAHGVFGVFPLTQLVVVADRRSKTHETKLARYGAVAQIPLVLKEA